MTWALDPSSNDMVIDADGKFQIVTGAYEIRQRILVTLLHDYQEYFLDTPAGTPWYEIILGSKDLTTVSAILRQIVLSVPGVQSIVDFNIGMSNRNVTVSISVEVTVGVGGTDIVDIISVLTHPISLLALNQNYNYVVGDKDYLNDSFPLFITE
jgi:hypothetical protein